jgi:hypothetical protein
MSMIGRRCRQRIGKGEMRRCKNSGNHSHPNYLAHLWVPVRPVIANASCISTSLVDEDTSPIEAAPPLLPGSHHSPDQNVIFARTK